MFRPPRNDEYTCFDQPGIETIKTASLSDPNKNVYIIRVRETELPRLAIVHYHGNMEDCSVTLPLLQFLSRNFDAVVYGVEYSGYGHSMDEGGHATMEEVTDDALSAYAYVQGEVTLPKILWGRSLGCALAIRAAAEYHCYGVVLESPFLTPLMVYLPFHLFFEDEFDNYSEIQHLSCPVIIAHGDDDKVVPFKHGETLFKLCKSKKKTFVRVQDAGHNNLYSTRNRGYLMGEIAKFISAFVLISL